MQRARVSLDVNGTRYERAVEARLLLVHLPPRRTRVGRYPRRCDTSNCGACAVHIDGDVVTSCTLLAVPCDGANVTTIEGIGTEDGLQPDPTEQEVRHALAGNRCRCTGYHNIVKAVPHAARVGREGDATPPESAGGPTVPAVGVGA